MRRAPYLEQLKKDIERWVDADLVSRGSVPAMLDLAGPAETRRSLPVILATLGAILLAFAAMTYVAANWQGMGKLAKLIILFSGMWAALGIAAELSRRNLEDYAHAALLFGSAMLGVNIMLVGQTYHINAHWPDGVLVWGIGVFAAALLASSRAALALAIILFSFWTWSETFQFEVRIHWPYMIAFFAALALAERFKWAPAFHLLLLSFVSWLIMNAVVLIEITDWEGPAVTALLMSVGALIWAMAHAAPTFPFARAMERYGMFLTFVLFFAMHTIGHEQTNDQTFLFTSLVGLSVFGVAGAVAVARSTRMRIQDVCAMAAALVAAIVFSLLPEPFNATQKFLYVALFIGLMLWAVDHGAKNEDNFVVNLAFVGFGAEVIYLYLSTFGTLLDQAAFFALGGVLLIIGSITLERIRRRVLTGEQGGAS
jgi:uncharacterized membrane protein